MLILKSRLRHGSIRNVLRLKIICVSWVGSLNRNRLTLWCVRIYYNKSDYLKKLLNRKKYNYKRGILNKMAVKKSSNNQKEFWNLLDKLSKKKTNVSNYIDHETLSSHFRSLLNNKHQIDIPPDSTERGPLDDAITLDELKKGSVTLKPGKALGIDNVDNEMILCLVHNYPQIILKLFNSILENNEIVPDWLVGVSGHPFTKSRRR